MTEARGFIVSAWDEGPRRRGEGVPFEPRILLTGRLDDGRSFAVVRKSSGPAVFVAAADREAAAAALASAFAALGATGPEVGACCDDEKWSDLAGRPLVRFVLPLGGRGRALRALEDARIQVAALEGRRADDELAALGVKGPVVIRGEERKGRRVDTVFVDPELSAWDIRSAASSPPSLRWLAIDIETSREGEVVAVSLAQKDRPGEVLFAAGGGRIPSAEGVEVFPDEGSLLGALAGRISRIDPDVITGWNIVDFDLPVLVERYAKQRLVFDAGRTDDPVTMVERSGRDPTVDFPGRAVIDALRLARASGSRFEDMSLETVAQEILGEGKTVSSRGGGKIDELEHLRAEDPDAFCAYCLRDSELVLRILAETGLDELTMRRAALTGVSLDLAWTSIPSFERVYGSALRSRRIVPPQRIERRVSGAAGGTILEPAAGLFPQVLVFDFRSLYPSIMRSFNVDPLAYERANAREARPDDILAPNGARFAREIGIMPALIAEYAAERERAIEEGDEVAAYVYKILQNSFYGVLGSEGCRYARTEIAGAITSFGKKFLVISKNHFESRGMRVLYGDTDSVFVLSGRGDEEGFAELMELGSKLAAGLNDEIAQRIKDEYGLESYLRIRCEKAYRRFLIPRLRTGGASEAAEGEERILDALIASEGRGRAKGYAGSLLDSSGASSVEVKGMEAVRSDFTPLSRRFQLDLLGLVFGGAGEDELREFCRNEIRSLRRGERDEQLVYRKTLRRPAEDYASETPQVRAARLMGWTTERGRIAYVMTKAGAEPIESRSGAPLDYDHYVERQLLPIAVSIAEVLGFDARRWFEGSDQIELEF
jgi:DNA polymerase-2